MKEMVMSEETIFGICKRLGGGNLKRPSKRGKTSYFRLRDERGYPIYGRFNETRHHPFHH